MDIQIDRYVQIDQIDEWEDRYKDGQTKIKKTFVKSARQYCNITHISAYIRLEKLITAKT